MRHRLIAAALAALAAGSPAMAGNRIEIASPWGAVTAEIADNDAARAFFGMLPPDVRMSDHLRQEKTGTLPSPLPEAARQRDFDAGTLGLWGPDDVVIYYREGRVPQPGIVILGHVDGDVSIFDRPGAVEIRLAPLAP